MRSIRRAVAAVAVAAVAALSAPTASGMALGAAAADGAHSAGIGAAYGQRGRVVDASPLTSAAALPSAARNLLVHYTSRGAKGQPIVVSGTVALPTGTPPPGGWPVISWAHGTTGTADACAPSRDTATGPAHDYLAGVDRTLDEWVRAGYVVVQTDYEGLGTPGDHPYMNARSAAATVADIVRAARHLDPRVGRDWIAMGHSQGGHAALVEAATAQVPHDINLLGVIALAPGGMALSQAAPFVLENRPGADYAVPFLPPLLLGAAAATDTVNADALVTATGERLLQAGRTGCLAAIRAASTGVKATDFFRPGADLAPLTAYLKAQELPYGTLRVPALVLQGAADVTVSKPSTDGLVQAYCSQGANLTYRVYAGADHRGVIPASLADAMAYAATLRSGVSPQTTCP